MLGPAVDDELVPGDRGAVVGGEEMHAKAAAVSSMQALTWDSTLTSVRIQTPSISLASAAASHRDAMTTLAPALPNRRAAARPIPLDPPVITVTLLASEHTRPPMRFAGH